MTALNWLEGLNENQQSLVQGVLFPVSAPVVSPLKFEQRQLLFGSDLPSNVRGNCELNEPLNEKQSDFVRMARARMLDASNVVRPPIILTGPAGEFAYRHTLPIIVRHSPWTCRCRQNQNLDLHNSRFIGTHWISVFT